MIKIIIGIDFSKETFDATLLDCRNSELSAAVQFAAHEKFTNKKEGFKACLAWIKSSMKKISNDELLLCGEKTGKYSLPFSNFLYTKGYPIWLESGLRIKRTLGIRRGKSDKADSLRIALYAYRYQDMAVCYVPLSKNVSRLKELFLYRQHLVSQVKAMSVRKNITDDFRKELGDVRFIVDSSTKIIEQIKATIKKCEEKMKELIGEDEELKTTYGSITSVKGISLINAAAFIAYTNNFKDFGGNAKKIATYWGVAAFSQESGTSVHKGARVSKIASKMLKSLLTQAARIAVRWEPRFREYFEHLISRGKHQGVALNNVKNKLIHLITALAVSQEMYNPAYERVNR